jgi:ankyrin repeat protein
MEVTKRRSRRRSRSRRNGVRVSGRSAKRVYRKHVNKSRRRRQNKKGGMNDNLWNIVRDGKLELVKQEINKEITGINKSDMVYEKYKNNDTLMHLAAEKGHTTIVGFLFNIVQDTSMLNKNNDTPLHLAAEKGHIDVVLLLLGKSSNPNRQNINRNTPLHLAANNGYNEIVKVLLDNTGLKTFQNIKNTIGDTPLHLATKKGHIDIVKQLLSYPKDVIQMYNNKNLEHETPMDIAKRLNFEVIIQLITPLLKPV